MKKLTDVPAEEKNKILAAFNLYMDTLNEQDIEGYLDTLSVKDYDIEEERAFMEEQFSE